MIIENKSVIIIDPCELENIKQMFGKEVERIDLCILTHEHYDHISGLDWMHKLGIPVLASKKCNKNLGNAKLNHSRYYRAFCELQERLEGDDIPDVEEYAGYADREFETELSFRWEGHELYLRETPGHSEGSICILIDGKMLFSGDTLFSSIDTNASILGGDQKKLESVSIPWIRSLNPDITVYPGHYDVFKLGDRLKKANQPTAF